MAFRFPSVVQGLCHSLYLFRRRNNLTHPASKVPVVEGACRRRCLSPSKVPIFVHGCEASSLTVSYSPARHPPCVDGSPVWQPDRDVYSKLLHATELASVVASFGTATCPAARFASTWASQCGKRRDGNGDAQGTTGTQHFANRWRMAGRILGSLGVVGFLVKGG